MSRRAPAPLIGAALASLALVSPAIASLALAASRTEASPPASARAGLRRVRAPLVAFVRGTLRLSVWVGAAGGGRARRLGPGADPLISPNGAYVAAAQLGSGGTGLVLYTIGGAARRFFAHEPAGAAPLAWSPDSRYLAVALNPTTAGSTRGAGLALIDTRTMRVARIARGVIEGASFAPVGAARIVYASSSSMRFTAPVWGALGIAFARERLRAGGAAPVYQVWLKRGSRLTRLTDLRVPMLLDGLRPVQFSADGRRLLAEYVGEDTSQAWTITLRPLRVREVRVDAQQVQGYAISRNGRELLVDSGGFEAPPSAGRVESVAFGGGRPALLYRGDQPSWDR
jgi:dipeptidyl aminopeptidase/acylaminoacyl peptidase